MKTFNVSYSIVTPESAENGDFDECGMIAENVSLHDAVQDLFSSRTSACDSGDGLQDSGRWFDYMNGIEYETGAQETRSLHPPKSITQSSYARLYRALRRY